MSEFQTLILEDNRFIPVIIRTSLVPGSGCHLSGLPALKEADTLLRVLTAMQEGLDFGIPNKKILINVGSTSPLKYEFSHLDLPIALSLYAAANEYFEYDASNWIITGELKLNGEISVVNNSQNLLNNIHLLPGDRKVFIPEVIYKLLDPERKRYAYPANNLQEVIGIIDKF